MPAKLLYLHGLPLSKNILKGTYIFFQNSNQKHVTDVFISLDDARGGARCFLIFAAEFDKGFPGDKGRPRPIKKPLTAFERPFRLFMSTLGKCDYRCAEIKSRAVAARHSYTVTLTRFAGRACNSFCLIDSGSHASNDTVECLFDV